MQHCAFLDVIFSHYIEFALPMSTLVYDGHYL